MTNKHYDVVDMNGKLLCRGYALWFNGDEARIEKRGPFGSGVVTVQQNQLRPFMSVKDQHQPTTARTQLWGS